MIDNHTIAATYKSSFLVPELVEIQRRSFARFLEHGVVEEFSKINPIRSQAAGLELTFYPANYLLVLPDYTVTGAVLQGKTYSCKMYVPARLAPTDHGVRESGQPTKGRGAAPSETVHSEGCDATSPGDMAPISRASTDRRGVSTLWPAQASPGKQGGLRGHRPTPQAVAPVDLGDGATSDSSRRPHSGVAHDRRHLPMGGPSKGPEGERGRPGVEPPIMFSIGSPHQADLAWPSTPSNANSSWVLVASLPLMTRRGHFIINGSPRVMVNQLIRSPGVYFHERIWGLGKRRRRLVYADFVSRRGAWLRIQTDNNGNTWARLKKTPKIPFWLFCDGMAICERATAGWSPGDRETLLELCEETDTTGRLPSAEKGQQFLVRRFKNPRTYDLGPLGRDRLNKRLGLSVMSCQLTSNDLYAALDHMKGLLRDQLRVDDIDHLKNRRVRGSGELVQGQFEAGLYRMERGILAKLRKPLKGAGLRSLIDTRPIDGALRELFGASPLSQYMDQTNPLAEITHKRRMSSLGPGGINRENAGMAIRGIHPTHYGRICPIETPEGKNAGLVNSLTTHARIRNSGILETPYYKVLRGQAQRQLGLEYVSAEGEEGGWARVAPGDAHCSICRLLPMTPLAVREAGNPEEDFRETGRDAVNYLAISPTQMISVATSLIPFLEHDDANRALMGSNMQRQALPLLRPERPVVGTGLEALVVAESGHALQACSSGYVSQVDGKRVVMHAFSSSSLRGPHVAVSSNHSGRHPGHGTPGWGHGANPGRREMAWREGIAGSVAGLGDARRPGQDGGVHLGHQHLPSNRVGRKMALPSDVFARLRGLGMGMVAWPWEGRGLGGDRLKGWPQDRPASGADLHQSLPVGGVSPTGHGGGRLAMSVVEYHLHSYHRSNQETCLTQVPAISEGGWTQRGDLLADCSASQFGELALGKNLLIAYLPWEGYNFEDAVVISDRLIYDDVYTSIHVQKLEVDVRETRFGRERITRKLPGLPSEQLSGLDDQGLASVGSWVREGDLLVGKVSPRSGLELSPYERLAYDIADVEADTMEDTSLRVPKGVEGRVINSQAVDSPSVPTDGRSPGPARARIYLAERRRIQVGDKVAGRHGNKGIVSAILPRQDMPFLPNGEPVDMILNPLGIPSRMNVGQVFECLLGLAGLQLGQRFKVTPFDEIYGPEASRSLVYLKLYQARLRTNQGWLFNPLFPGKSALFDGRTGRPFQQWVTVGCAYMLKLVHLVDEKIHARSTGPYALVTKQPLGGRSKHGGQRLGEMEVWALEGFGAAYILQEMLTSKSDDIEGRQKAVESILFKRKMRLGNPEAFKVLISELQSLCLDVGVYAISPDRLHREMIDVATMP